MKKEFREQTGQPSASEIRRAGDPFATLARALGLKPGASVISLILDIVDRAEKAKRKGVSALPEALGLGDFNLEEGLDGVMSLFSSQGDEAHSSNPTLSAVSQLLFSKMTEDGHLERSKPGVTDALRFVNVVKKLRRSAEVSAPARYAAVDRDDADDYGNLFD